MELEPRATLIAAILVLFLGRYLNGKIRFFREYNIPEPVTGGLLASLIVGLLYWLADLEISFDMAHRVTLSGTGFRREPGSISSTWPTP